MGNDLVIGLQLSAIGLFTTFIALGLLILVMVVLQRIFPVKRAAVPEPPPRQFEMDDDDQRLEELAVALAVGISLLERERAFIQHDPSLGKLLEE